MSELEPLCPICRENTGSLVAMQTCQRCHDCLYTGFDENQTSCRADNQPLISQQVLEEVSLAIANNTEDVGCSASKPDKGVRHYYNSLNDWISIIDEINDDAHGSELPADDNESTSCVRCATYVSFFINVCLLVAKIIALSSSSSYTLISSLADSCLDLVAGILISWTAAKSKFTREDLSQYPVGKSRLTTVGILVFSILMAATSLYIIMEAALALINHEASDKTTTIGIAIMIATIVVKATMWIVYSSLGHALTSALAEDHRNDVLTNALGLFMYWGASNLGWWMDSTGGILLSLFVLVSWGANALENAKMLLGKSAPPEIIKAITYVAANHHPLILTVEQVIAFQVGPKYFVELHIVVPGHIPLEVAHWVGESLQLRVEKMRDIERSWVHVDCESHNENEHLLMMRATGKLDKRTTNVSPYVAPNSEVL